MLPIAVLGLAGCAPPEGSVGNYTSGETGESESDESESSASVGDEESDDGAETPVLDVGPGDGDGDFCHVDPDGMDAVPPCEESAPPESFDPVVQWDWAGDGERDQAVVTPLVANLTDDNENGEIDLCDTPDIVVVAYSSNDYFPGPDSRLYVFDGETGAVHWQSEDNVNGTVTPAIGDVDGDGEPEIVVGRMGLTVYEPDGTVLWEGAPGGQMLQRPISLADLDNDGDTEIMVGANVVDHEGNVIFADDRLGDRTAFAVDLDGDEDLEVLVGSRAYHHDGSIYYDYYAETGRANAQVADLDDDGQPEVLVSTSGDGLWVLEHDGSIKVQGAAGPYVDRMREAAIHDMDGDGDPEIAIGDANDFNVLYADLSLMWTTDVLDLSGNASGTAFDFLGDASAEAMYADETKVFAFGVDGETVFSAQRTSWTQREYPVVADVDDDGSAEVVVVSNHGYEDGMSAPVQVLRDAEDRWVGARRIWNQHAYHVTNVREDGTIPAFQPKNWETLNTFRTQAQQEGDGGVCKPPPSG
jgi:hypothetical protein